MNMDKYILERARKSIENESNWIKDTYYGDSHNDGDDNQCMCLAGAVRNARAVIEENTKNTFRVIEAFALLANQIQKLYPGVNYKGCLNEGVVINFNDDKDTTHSMILEIIDLSLAELNH